MGEVRGRNFLVVDLQAAEAVPQRATLKLTSRPTARPADAQVGSQLGEMDRLKSRSTDFELDDEPVLDDEIDAISRHRAQPFVD